jgi:hypothetical protein
MGASFLKSGIDYLPAYSPNTQSTGALENATVATSAFFRKSEVYDYNLDKKISERDDFIKNNFTDFDYVGTAKLEAEKAMPKPEGFFEKFTQPTPIEASLQQRNLNDKTYSLLDAQIIEGRKSNPEKWAGINTTEEIKQYYNQEINSQRQVVADYSSRGAGTTSKYVAPFVGEIAGSMLDPINIATLPLGMGAANGILKTIAGEAAINMGIEATQLPANQRVETALGTPMSASDMALQVATAGIGAGVITGVAKGLPPAYNFIRNRANRIKAMNKIAESVSVPKSVKYAAKWIRRKSEVEDNIPQEIIDAVQTNNPNITPETAVNKAVQIHRENLQKTLDAIEAGRQPDYNSIPRYDANDDILAPQPSNIRVDNAEQINRTTLGIEQSIPKAETMLADWKANKTKLQDSWKQKLGYNPQPFHQWVKQQGGLVDKGGELRTRGVTPKTFVGGIRAEYKGNRSKGYEKNIDRKTGFAVGSMEQFNVDGTGGLLQRAINEGYFPQAQGVQYDDYATMANNAPTMDDFYDLLAKSIQEEPIYRQSDVDAMRNWEQANVGTVESNPYGITNRTTPYELAQKLYYEKLDLRDQKRNLMHNNIHEKLMATGRNDLPLWEYQDMIMTSYDSFVERYGDVDDAFEAAINNFFDGLDIGSNQGAFSPNDARILYQGGNNNYELPENYTFRETISNEVYKKENGEFAVGKNNKIKLFIDYTLTEAERKESPNLVRQQVASIDFYIDPEKPNEMEFDSPFTKEAHRKKGVIKAAIQKIFNDYPNVEIIKNSTGTTTDGAALMRSLGSKDGNVITRQDFENKKSTTLYQRGKKQPPDNSTPSLEGFEPISQRELIERKMEGASKAKVAQKGMQGETNLFDQSELKQDTLFQPAKGSITFNGNQATITLFKDADASTFIHEMGHFYTNMMRELAAHEKAPAELKADWQTIEDFVGAERGQKFTVEQEEKLARGFEQYMREGIAPNEQLKSLFATIKDWLMQIYQSRRDLDVELNDDIRQVFDRWLTPDVTRKYASKNDSYDAMVAAKLSDDQTLFSKTQSANDLFYEAGDFYVSTMQEAILQPSTSVKALKDYQAIVNFVGGDMRTPLNVVQKQQIADAVETHFMTGNPPNEELREVFSNMRKLASSKYEELWNSDAYIPDDIVAVMDKWRQPAMIEPNDFVTNSVNDKSIPPQLEFEQSEIDFAQQADFARLVRDFGDEIDEVTGLSYNDINAMIEADNNIIAAMQTCAR